MWGHLEGSLLKRSYSTQWWWALGISIFFFVPNYMLSSSFSEWTPPQPREQECSLDLVHSQGQTWYWPWSEWWRPQGQVPGAPCSQCPAPDRTLHLRPPGSSSGSSWWWWLSAEGLHHVPRHPRVRGMKEEGKRGGASMRRVWMLMSKVFLQQT